MEDGEAVSAEAAESGVFGGSGVSGCSAFGVVCGVEAHPASSRGPQQSSRKIITPHLRGVSSRRHALPCSIDHMAGMYPEGAAQASADGAMCDLFWGLTQGALWTILSARVIIISVPE